MKITLKNNHNHITKQASAEACTGQSSSFEITNRVIQFFFWYFSIVIFFNYKITHFREFANFLDMRFN